MPPLHAPHALHSLTLDGFGAATVALPRGATAPRPVVVALHGHAVRPEHACARWQHATQHDPFVLCPHGLPADAAPSQPVTLGSAAHTEREIEAGRKALEQQFGPYIAPGPLVLAGYSLGARIAAELVRRDPSRFARAALGEGAYQQLDRATLQRYAGHGVARLLLICSSKACELTFTRTLQLCEQVGLACNLAPAGEHPHRFDGAVVDATRHAWPWLVEGDPRFAPSAPPLP